MVALGERQWGERRGCGCWMLVLLLLLSSRGRAGCLTGEDSLPSTVAAAAKTAWRPREFLERARERDRRSWAGWRARGKSPCWLRSLDFPTERGRHPVPAEDWQQKPDSPLECRCGASPQAVLKAWAGWWLGYSRAVPRSSSPAFSYTSTACR